MLCEKGKPCSLAGMSEFGVVVDNCLSLAHSRTKQTCAAHVLLNSCGDIKIAFFSKEKRKEEAI